MDFRLFCAQLALIFDSPDFVFQLDPAITLLPDFLVSYVAAALNVAEKNNPLYMSVSRASVARKDAKVNMLKVEVTDLKRQLEVCFQ